METFASTKQVDGIVFSRGARAFTITFKSTADPFLISGTGVSNNSGMTQNFAVNPGSGIYQW